MKMNQVWVILLGFSSLMVDQKLLPSYFWLNPDRCSNPTLHIILRTLINFDFSACLLLFDDWPNLNLWLWTSSSYQSDVLILILFLISLSSYWLTCTLWNGILKFLPEFFFFFCQQWLVSIANRFLFSMN